AFQILFMCGMIISSKEVEKMGFLDALKSTGEYINAKLPEKYESIFRSATDTQLLEWWAVNEDNPDIDPRQKEMAEKEMRRRGFNY
ncbi:MAG: hypothetical protein NC177_01515, partial [Ruminococcus flavefaciens]|nr:hypothetical protein [Ruminococcus flavefaciens]